MLPKLQESNNKCRGETGDIHEFMNICLIECHKIDIVPEVFQDFVNTSLYYNNIKNPEAWVGTFEEGCYCRRYKDSPIKNERLQITK
jgi:hypothetical protein